MTDAVSREIHNSCLALERYRIATYAGVELSAASRDDGVIHIKPMGECGIHTLPADSCHSLHAKLYARFAETSSILLVNSDWIGVSSGAGWTLDRQSYGYIPSFSDTVPCTAKVRTPTDSAEYPDVLCDAISDATHGGKLPRALLVRSRGAVIFARSPMEAAEYAITLEYAAKKAFHIRKFR